MDTSLLTAESAAKSVGEIIEDARLGPVHWWTLVFCALIAALDGFDVLVMAFAAPVLAQQWTLDSRHIGFLLGAAPIGMALGAATIAPLADKVGRKHLLMLACGLAGIGTLASAFTASVWPLGATRLITGLGIGTALPTLTTLTSEISPDRWRNLFISIVTNGYSVGTITGAIVAGSIIHTLGWQGLFWFGGVGPLLLIPFLWACLAESPHYYAGSRRAGSKENLAKVLEKLYGKTVVLRSEEGQTSTGERMLGVGRLLAGNLRQATLMSWIAFFCSFFVVYFIFQWIPTIIHSAGYSLDDAFRASLVASVGGLLGPFAVAGLSRYVSLQRSIVIFFVLGGLGTALIGAAGQSLALIVTLIFLSSFFTLGAEMGLFMFTARLYPTSARAGGVGWALGVGRFGAIFGPIVGGFLIGMGGGAPFYFPLFGAALIVAALAIHRSRFRGDSFAI